LCRPATHTVGAENHVPSLTKVYSKTHQGTTWGSQSLSFLFPSGPPAYTALMTQLLWTPARSQRGGITGNSSPRRRVQRRHRLTATTYAAASPPRLHLPRLALRLDSPRSHVRCGYPYPHALLPHAPMPLPPAGRVWQSYGGLTLRGDPGAISENNAVRSGACDLDSLLLSTSPPAVGWRLVGGADVYYTAMLPRHLFWQNVTALSHAASFHGLSLHV